MVLFRQKLADGRRMRRIADCDANVKIETGSTM